VKIYYIPYWFADLLTVMGLFMLFYITYWALQNLVSLYYHKETYKNPKDLRYFLLLEENKRLNQKNSLLEQENNEIMSNIIKQLNNN
jgi:hypothetical protein